MTETSQRDLFAEIEGARNSTYEMSVAGRIYQLKLDLLSRSTPAEVAVMFARHLSAKTAEFDLMPLRDFASHHSIEFHEYAPERITNVRIPRIRGKPPSSPQPIRSRSLYTCALADVVVTGRSSFVRTGNRLLFDHAAAELSDYPVDFRMDPLVFDQRGRELLALDMPDPVGQIDEAISLVGVTSYSFGHWMIEYLPKQLLLWEQGLARGLPIIIDSRMQPQHREALEVYAAGRHPIIELRGLSSLRVRKLWIAATLCFIPTMPSAGTTFGLEHVSPPTADTCRLFNLHARLPSNLPNSGGRLYLARSMERHRRLLNYAQIMQIARAHGFKIVYPEEHSFIEQCALMRGADHIVAPEGSALMVAVHARPRARMLILNHPFLENLPALTSIIEENGVDLHILEGECARLDPAYRKLSDYTICPNEFASVLREWGLEARF